MHGDSLSEPGPHFSFEQDQIFWIDADSDQAISYCQLFADLTNTIQKRYLSNGNASAGFMGKRFLAKPAANALPPTTPLNFAVDDTDSPYTELVNWIAAIITWQDNLVLPCDSDSNFDSDCDVDGDAAQERRAPPAGTPPWDLSSLASSHVNCDRQVDRIPLEPKRDVSWEDRMEPLRRGAMTLSEWQALILDSPTQILLATSGSTGMKKQFWHSITSLTRGVRLDQRHWKDVWGLAYPPNHLAGLQVLFQALLNGNRLVKLYGQPVDLIHQILADQQISHLSCTPTFLRLLLSGDQIHPSLVRLTNGGERYDSQLDARIRRMFPNAQRRNIYAATETGNLMSSANEEFEIPLGLQNMIKIIDNQLWLHRLLRRPQAAEKSPHEDPDTAAALPEFWPTSDRVKIVNEDPLTIRFLSRTSEGFNVAGNRVDSVRLEEIARRHPLIIDAKFYGIPNSVTENLVGCDLVVDSNRSPSWQEQEFRLWLQSQLERHEQPRLIRLVDHLKMTSSTKVDRK